MYRKQLRFSLRASTTTGARDTPGIRILKGVEGRAVQPPGSARAESGRSESGFWGRRIVEASDELPSTFVSREDVGLAIMTSSDDGVLGGPYEGDERESGHSDGTNCGTRSRIDDADGAGMIFGSILNIKSLERGFNGLTCKCENVSGWRERNGVDPTSGRAGKFTANSAKWKLFTPERGCGPE